MTNTNLPNGLRETAEYLDEVVFTGDIAELRDAIELARNKLYAAAELLARIAKNGGSEDA